MITNEELKQALINGTQVTYENNKYTVRAVRYTYNKMTKQVMVSAEMVDGNKNCLVTALAKDITI